MASSGGRPGRDDKLEALRGLPWAGGATDDDLRWLGRIADSFTRSPGGVVARRTSPSRWSYVVVAGTVSAGAEVLGPGAVVVPDEDVIALTEVEVLAFPRQEEPALRRRFPRLDAAPVEPR